MHGSGAACERRADRQPRWVDHHRLGGERGRHELQHLPGHHVGRGSRHPGREHDQRALHGQGLSRQHRLLLRVHRGELLRRIRSQRGGRVEDDAAGPDRRQRGGRGVRQQRDLLRRKRHVRRGGLVPDAHRLVPPEPRLVRLRFPRPAGRGHGLLHPRQHDVQQRRRADQRPVHDRVAVRLPGRPLPQRQQPADGGRGQRHASSRPPSASRSPAASTSTRTRPCRLT